MGEGEGLVGRWIERVIDYRTITRVVRGRICEELDRCQFCSFLLGRRVVVINSYCLHHRLKYIVHHNSRSTCNAEKKMNLSEEKSTKEKMNPYKKKEM